MDWPGFLASAEHPSGPGGVAWASEARPTAPRLKLEAARIRRGSSAGDPVAFSRWGTDPRRRPGAEAEAVADLKAALALDRQVAAECRLDARERAEAEAWSRGEP